MAIKNRGRNGSVTLVPKWGFGWILLAAVAILIVVGVSTMPTWGRFFNRVTITVPVPKPTQVHTTKPPVTKPTTPTQPTKPTQPVQQSQTFASSPTTVGEAMLGSYWTGGKLYYTGTYTLLFTLSEGAELRAPFAGTIGMALSSDTNTSSGFVIFPELSVSQSGAGNSVFYGGNSLRFLVTNGQTVSAGQVVAKVVAPTISAELRGQKFDGNVVVGYGATTPPDPHTYTYTSVKVLEEAFPYVKDLVPGK